MASPSTTSLITVVTPDSNVKPLTLDNEHVLGLVYDCYEVQKPTKNGETFDPDADLNPDALFSNVVADILMRSLRTYDPNIKFDFDQENKVDKTKPAQLEPPIAILKRLACQMREAKREDVNHTNAHKTTMSILRNLAKYSWYAKAVAVIAAFALEYGIFWNLYEQKKLPGGQDSLGYSLAVLNNVHVDAAVKKWDIPEYNVVVKDVLETVHQVVKLESFIKKYQGMNVPTLEKAMQENPAFVYWTVLTIVILASQLDVLLGAPKYKLSDIGSKISTLRTQLNEYIGQIRKQTAFIDEYQHRDRIAFQTPTGIVQVLKCLLFPLDLKDYQVYDGSTQSMVSIDVFKTNHVLVFISGLYSIDDETYLLKKIYEGLKQSDPRIVKGIRKDAFKILWAPIVHESDMSGENNRRFLEMRRKMKWYVVDYTIIPDPICKMLIEKRLNYKNNPIMPVFNPHGVLLNDNALHMLFTWELQAFPWRKGDDSGLIQEWNWLWNDLKKSNPELNSWINEDAYIIVWGRTDSDFSDDQWLMKMAGTLERIANDEIIRRFDIRIKYCHHGKDQDIKDERNTVSNFWAYVESTFDGLRRTDKEEVNQETFKQVKSFLGLRQEHTGWVVLSKGPSVKLLGRGECFYQTLTEFNSWKLNIEKDSGFDVSLKHQYDYLMSKRPRPTASCSHVVLKLTHLCNVYDPILCPHCGQAMKFNLAEFVCCHGQKDQNAFNVAADNNADALGGDVEIVRPGRF